MRAVAYIRVSDASQVEGHSLNAQERLFRQLCETRGWEFVDIYREEGRSAKTDAIARRSVFRAPKAIEFVDVLDGVQDGRVAR